MVIIRIAHSDFSTTRFDVIDLAQDTFRELVQTARTHNGSGDVGESKQCSERIGRVADRVPLTVVSSYGWWA